MKNLESCINDILINHEADNIAVVVGKNDEIITELYKSNNSEINGLTRFDMASVTKIMATTMIALIALDDGKLKLFDKVSDYFACPDIHKETTIKNLLTHTIGIGHKNLCDKNYDYSNISDFILSIPLDVPVGSEVLYSCPGYVLLGKILEKIYGEPLDVLFEKMVAEPLGMQYSSFLPKGENFVNSHLEDENKGVVNDYNCRYLGGVAGNAGLFSNISDIKKFVKMLLGYGLPLISKETFCTAIKNYTYGIGESRGLGFVYVDEKYKQTGELFSVGSIGHCGHTGQSVFVDPKSGLYVIILSDMTICTTKKYGKEKYTNVIALRERIHNAILNDLKTFD